MMRRFSRRLPAMLAALLTLVLQAPAASTTSADSEAILKRAHHAQTVFEHVRRDHLKLIEHQSSDHCDELIADLCLTYGDPKEIWNPPKEPDEVGVARDSLIALLSLALR